MRELDSEDINRIGCLFIIACLASLFCSNTNMVLSIVVATISVVSVYIFIHILEKTHRDCELKKEFFQSLILFLLLEVSILLVGIGNYDYFKNMLPSTLIIIGLCIVLCFFIYEVYILWKYYIVSKVKNANKMLWVLLAVALLLSLEIVGGWDRWDSYNYQYEFSKLSIEHINELGKLRVCNHTSIGYSLIVVILNSIIKDVSLTLELINLIIYILGIIGFYMLIKDLMPKIQEKERILGTMIYMFLPATFGTIWTFSLDYFLFPCLVLFILAISREYRIFEVLLAILICFTKENAVPIVGCIVFLDIVRQCLKKLQKIGNFDYKVLIESFFKTHNMTILFAAIVWLSIYVLVDWTGTNSGKAPTVDGANFNSFGISYIYIKDKLMSLFLYNFMWLMLLIILGVGIYILRNKRKKGEKISWKFHNLLNNRVAVLLIGLFVVNLLINIFFITYNHIRYGFLNSIPLLCLFIYALYRIQSKKMKNGIYGLLIGLMLIQSQYTIDPSMLLTGARVDIGNAYLVSIKDNARNIERFYFSDSAVYNRQILHYDEAINILLDKMEYKNKDYLLFCEEESMAQYYTHGYGYNYTEIPYYWSWNEEEKKIVLSTDSSVHAGYRFWKYNSIPEILNPTKKIYYIKLPWQDEEFDKLINEQFEILKEYEVKYKGWILNGYQLSIKSN